MPKRSYSGAGSYRYGFNGKENDNDVKGLGNQQDYGMRILDVRVGRFLSVDPLINQYPDLTPYQFASNRPIDGTDRDGSEWELGSEAERSKRQGEEALRKLQEKSITSNVFFIHNEPEILAPDIYGRGWIGPQSIVEANIKITQQQYYFSIGENIRGGPFGAIGYLVGGDEGSQVGTAVDGIAMSVGGLPGESPLIQSSNRNVLAKPGININKTPFEHPPVNLSINMKKGWTSEQIDDAVKKVNIISESKESFVTLKNPETRSSNLRAKFIKAGNSIKSTQQLDHKLDLQLNGKDNVNNAHALDGSVNTSLGRQFNLQIRNLPDNTRVNKVGIKILSFPAKPQ